jgi:superfamily I DNA and/or RNA helicase
MFNNIWIRGKNLVILGDEKQLPPSQWFVAREDDEDNDDEDTDRSLLSESLHWQAMSLASHILHGTIAHRIRN